MIKTLKTLETQMKTMTETVGVLEAKVRQLENKVQAIEVLLSQLHPGPPSMLHPGPFTLDHPDEHHGGDPWGLGGQGATA